MIRPQRNIRSAAKAAPTPVGASGGTVQAWCYRDSQITTSGDSGPPPLVFDGVAVDELDGDGVVVTVTVAVRNDDDATDVGWQGVLTVNDTQLDDHPVMIDTNTNLASGAEYTVSATCMIEAAAGDQIGIVISEAQNAELAFSVTMTLIAVSRQTDPCCEEAEGGPT